MTTPAERYADLLGGRDDPALARLVEDLDRLLRAPAPPPALRAAPRHRARSAEQSPARATLAEPPLLTRKAAIAAGAAGAAWLLASGHAGNVAAGGSGDAVPGEPMTAARLVAILRAERAAWDALLAQVGPGRMSEPGVEGTWSVKEIVAHLTWYERVVVMGARQIQRRGVYEPGGLAGLSMDERNARIAAEARATPPRDVLAESDRVFGQLCAVIAACPDDVLNDPRRLGLPADVVPWMLVAGNTYEHYRQHAPAIRTWLEAQKPS